MIVGFIFFYGSMLCIISSSIIFLVYLVLVGALVMLSITLGYYLYDICVGCLYLHVSWKTQMWANYTTNIWGDIQCFVVATFVVNYLGVVDLHILMWWCFDHHDALVLCRNEALRWMDQVLVIHIEVLWVTCHHFS